MEVTTKYVQVVNSLDDAFTFILQQTEKYKNATPKIQILPFWDYGDDPKGDLKFEATVSIWTKQDDGQSL